ncbi:hypothetical protein Tco_1438680 [Tanacetum coccineum]
MPCNDLIDVQPCQLLYNVCDNRHLSSAHKYWFCGRVHELPVRSFLRLPGRVLQGSGIREKVDGKDKKIYCDKDNDKALFQKKKLNVVSKDKPKSTVEKASDVVSDKPVVKKMVMRRLLRLLRVLFEKENPKVIKGKSKKEVFRFRLETDVVDEADRKIKRSRKDESEDRVPKKVTEKIDIKGEERRSDEDTVLRKARTTPTSLFSCHRKKTQRVDILGFLTAKALVHCITVSIDHLPLKLGDGLPVFLIGGYSLFDLMKEETDPRVSLFKRAESKLLQCVLKGFFSRKDLMRKASSAYPGCMESFKMGNDDNDNDGDGNGDEEDANRW